MRPLIIFVLLMLLCSCSHIQINYTDPVTGAAQIVTVDGPRKAAISVGNVTVIMGEVAINNDTVQVLVKEAVPVVAGVASPVPALGGTDL